MTKTLSQHIKQITTSCWHTALSMLSHYNVRPATHSPSKKILVIRSNYRIGNNLFLRHFLKALQDKNPNATIDLVISKKPYDQFFSDLNIRVFYMINFKLSGRKYPIKQIWQQLRKLRSTTYHAVYVPFPSGNDETIAAFTKAETKIGFKDRHSRLYTTLYNTPKDCHYALKPLTLLGLDTTADIQPYLSIPLPNQPHAQQIARQALPTSSSNTITIAIFRGARKGKGLTDTQWMTILDTLKQHFHTAQLIEVLGPDVPGKPLLDTVYQTPSLTTLSAFLSQLHAFISCDTGPLHLACAAGAPAIGLFTKTQIRQYGCLSHNALNLSINPHAIDIEPILRFIQHQIDSLKPNAITQEVTD